MKSDIDCGHKYTRDEIIGKGSYATVYVGKHIQTARRVALKQISLFCAQDGKEDEYLGVPVSAARELSILKQMRHKNIISLFDCFSCPEYITLVFEYIPEDLRKYMDKKGSNISSQDIRLISEQILSGVAYLHSRQVIHRDLKPGNILVSSSTDIRIADFGMGGVRISG
ncbi:Cell division protein kinase 2 CRK1 [Thelohanellus kitauei]|uniref:Cell division protein kinase 2 CRK1 n=1 Tax=Thelohanellus kitauei TaxID=669202 RepID=A0A0C2J1Z0_THEKT|nr:Cell division protein kinase 2 CRK1 [Thelohanellus kitauei]